MPETKDTNDINDLASRYLDLWQKQLGSFAENSETTEVIAKTLELMNSGSAAFATMAAGAQSENAPNETNAGTKPGATKTSATKSADEAKAPTPSSGAANLDVDQLLERIATLEKRVSALESGTAKLRKKASARPRKSKHTS